MPLVLVIGGTRSGKSAIAEGIAGATGRPVTYVATGSASDPEMAERIAAHRRRRPPGWRTVETADPAAALAAGDTVLVDALGPWLATLMHEAGLLVDSPVAALGPEGQAAAAVILARVRALAAAAAGRPALTVVVAEEAGLGPVALGAATRRYLDLAGEAAQILAAAASRAVLVVAGRTLELDVPSEVTHLGGLRRHGDEMVPPGAADFAVNVVDDDPPAWLADAMAGALAHPAPYPDEGPAWAAVAERHGRDAAEVVLTNGAAEAFWLLAAALRPHRAVCVHPDFTEPEAALRAHGRRVERAFRDPEDFALDPSAVPAGADLVTLGNPSNPAGRLEAGDRVAALCRPGRATVVDEAFMDFVPGQAASLAGRRDLPGLVVVRSLTKLWGLAGVRAGYLLAPAEIAARVRRMRPPWSVNAVALEALRACAGHDGESRARATAAAREDLRAALDALPGVRTWPSAANFLLMRVSGGERIRAALLQRGIAVRPAATFPGLGPDHLRVTVRAPTANARLVAAMAEALACA